VLDLKQKLRLNRILSHVGIAADHGGYALKLGLLKRLKAAGYKITDFGDKVFKRDDDYPDYILPLARALAAGAVGRGVGICGSGVGATICANKIVGVRACLINDMFSARQGVEDDDLNMICFGGRVIDLATAWELLLVFLKSCYSDVPRFQRSLAKIAVVEAHYHYDK
jgi:ribose 5-phosphate isomerase B